MTYNAIAAAAQDQHLRSRIAACIAQETPGRTEHPIVLADQIQWRVVAAPGLADAYSYAVAVGEIDEPGKDESVITDVMLLAAVQPLVVTPVVAE
jgi:hypothetical protein